MYVIFLPKIHPLNYALGLFPWPLSINSKSIQRFPCQMVVQIWQNQSFFRASISLADLQKMSLIKSSPRSSKPSAGPSHIKSFKEVAISSNNQSQYVSSQDFQLALQEMWQMAAEMCSLKDAISTKGSSPVNSDSRSSTQKHGEYNDLVWIQRPASHVVNKFSASAKSRRLQSISSHVYHVKNATSSKSCKFKARKRLVFIFFINVNTNVIQSSLIRLKFLYLYSKI